MLALLFVLGCSAFRCPAVVVKDQVIGAKAYYSTSVPDVASCCSLCASAAPACAAFTFEAHKGVCYLKNNTDATLQREGAISGAMPAAPTPPPAPFDATVAVATAALRSTVDPGFKCWNIDASPNRQWDLRDLSDPLLHSLGRQSLPGYLRFGGSGNDGLNYALDMLDATGAGNTCVKGASRCLNRTWFDNLMGFAKASHAPIVFGLNILAGAGTRWDSSDARALITYAIHANYSFYGFELGNEQDRHFTAREEAEAFDTLRQLLVELFPDASSRPKIIGCDQHGFHHPPSQNPDDEGKLVFMSDFAANCSEIGVPLHAMTHHECEWCVFARILA